MLSHLVGASNRADIQKLVLLTEEKERLIEELSTTRQQMRTGWSRRDKELLTLRHLLAERAHSETEAVTDDTDVNLALKNTVAHSEKRIRAQAARLRSLEEVVRELRCERDDIIQEVADLRSRNQALSAEVTELERSLDDPDNLMPGLQGQTVLYVGGVSKGVKFVRSAIEQIGAEFLHHDGGQEQATVLLRGLVKRANIVLVALDFVSHDAALLCKNLCGQQQKIFIPLPHAGVGSVIRALREHADARPT
jgi:hypothetical protein